MDATVFALEVVSVLVFDLRYDSLAPRSAPHSNRTLWSSRPHKHSLCSCATSYPDRGSLHLFPSAYMHALDMHLTYISIVTCPPMH